MISGSIYTLQIAIRKDAKYVWKRLVTFSTQHNQAGKYGKEKQTFIT